jgi:glycosyltransferase involved in cell wall biosynthesis
MLTSQILTKNNAKTIQRTLDSVLPLGSELLVADLGSTDETVAICQRNGARVIKATQGDMARIHNTLTASATYDWQLWIEPWEALTEASQIVSLTSGPKDKAYNLSVMRGDLMTSESRVWNRDNKWKFKNPVYEYLDVPDEATQNIHCVLFSNGERDVSLKDILTWRKDFPAANEPIYYEAFHYLSKQEWDKFLGKAQQYLFNEKRAIRPNIMIKYYMAVVLCHVKRKASESAKHVIEGLAVRPLMAELWCLLGDIHYHLMHHYKKANTFYHNATLLGSQRDLMDGWPVEMQKYKNYPTKMMESCQKMLDLPTVYSTTRKPS